MLWIIRTILIILIVICFVDIAKKWKSCEPDPYKLFKCIILVVSIISLIITFLL